MREASKATTVVIAVYLLTTLVSLAQEYTIDWNTFDGGGLGVSDASTGGAFTLSATIGQPDARNHPQPMTGGSYTLTGGFWVIPECPAIPADYDNDCDVDQADYALFESCASGPGYPFAGECENRDFDEDGDVDQGDFAAFQGCLSSPDIPGDPRCAN